MKRATITLPDDLNERLEAYLKAQPVAPSLTKVMQTALEQFLKEQDMQRELAKRGYKPPLKWPITFPVDEQGSGRADISVNHDAYAETITKD